MNNKQPLTLYLTLFLFFGSLTASIAGSSFFKPEKTENKEIDSLIVVAENFYENENFDKALLYFNKVLEKSTEINYSKGLTKAYIGYSAIYFIKNRLDVSTSFLLKAKAERYARENPHEMYMISFREGLNLHALGLYDEAIKKYKESITFSKKISDKEDQLNKLVGVYINIGDIYQLKNQNDSAFYYYKNAYASETTNYNNKFTSSVSISDLYIVEGKLDSARKYLEFAKYYSGKMESVYSEAVYSQISGKYYEASGDLDNAILSFQKSVLLNEKLNRNNPGILKLLADVYDKNGEDELANSYLKKYVEVNDSLEENRKKNLKVPLLIAKTESNHNREKAESKTNIFLIIFGAFLALTSVLVFLYVRKQKRKNLYRKAENIHLKKKLNSAFEEVVELAQINSPNFLSRFIEVYPEFYKKLTTDYPNLTTADLKLCALMKLDFSTKEIAEITFSSLRTVQNRKYKLRKKFELETEENINQWIQNLHMESLAMV